MNNTNTTEKNLTGYPSIDKPWMKYYPSELISSRKKFDRILDKLKDVWTDPDEIIIHYYGADISAGDFFDRVNDVAKALTAMGIGLGDAIFGSLESVPEYIELLLASEMIGCSIKNYLGEADEIIKLINSDDTVKLYIAPDYLSASEVASILAGTNVKSIITVDPLFSVEDRKNLRSNIADVINSKYTSEKPLAQGVISWVDFLQNGKKVGSIKLNDNNSIRLFSAFTSGTSGTPKEVLHTTKSVLGILDQLSMSHSKCATREKWLLSIFPPTLVAAIVSMILHPLADGKLLILDPYVGVDDLDLEMMYYEPNCWGMPPAFFELLLNSERISDNYDMSYFKLIGFGADLVTKRFICRAGDFLERHNCKAPLSAGYGQSEGGSAFAVCINYNMLMTGSVGIPHIDTVLSVFDPQTHEELPYNQVGEICKSGPGIMLGYSDPELTDEVIKKHSDGNMWLHTRDFGYMTEEGLLYVLGRNPINVFPDKKVFAITVANKLSDIDGIKDLVVVGGKDKAHDGFELPYLFIIPEKDQDVQALLNNVNELITEKLLPEETPAEIFLIDKKPIKRFKTDTHYLQEKYGLI